MKLRGLDANWRNLNNYTLTANGPIAKNKTFFIRDEPDGRFLCVPISGMTSRGKREWNGPTTARTNV